MIIDIHRHAVAKNWESDNFWNGLARMIVPIVKRMGLEADIEMVVNDIFSGLYDVDGEKHLAQMETASIDKTVMFAFDVGLMVGEPEIAIEEQNKLIFEMAARYPEKIIPFVHIDPRRPGAKEFVKKSFEEWGARGLKMHPGSGFNPEEKETLELIGTIADYGLPVIIHTGPSVPPTSSRFCDPIYLDRMLLKFPELNIIAAHLGYGYRTQLLSLGKNRPNLYADFAAWQHSAANDYDEFAKAIKTAVDELGPERVLFGTDSPYLWGVMSDMDYVNAVRGLSSNVPMELQLSEVEIEMILGGNAQNLLKL